MLRNPTLYQATIRLVRVSESPLLLTSNARRTAYLCALLNSNRYVLYTLVVELLRSDTNSNTAPNNHHPSNRCRSTSRRAIRCSSSAAPISSTRPPPCSIAATSSSSSSCCCCCLLLFFPVVLGAFVGWLCDDKHSNSSDTTNALARSDRPTPVVWRLTSTSRMRALLICSFRFDSIQYLFVCSTLAYRHKSMATYNEHLKPSMSDIELMRLFSLSAEFRNMSVRQVRAMSFASCCSANRHCEN
jgi:hypothetical protein